MSKRRRKLLWTSIAVLAVLLIVHGVGRMLPDHVILLHRSATAERLLMIGGGSVGFITVSDPTGYAIPYGPRWQEVVEPNSFREVRGSGVPLVYRAAEAAWTTRQGNPVTIRWWDVSYLLPAGAAAMVVIGNGLFWMYQRASLGLVSMQAKRRERRYSTAERCPACGYDVRESAERCPECGQAFVRRTVILAAQTK